VLFLSGFSALVLEVTWARHFHLIFGTSIYAFSLVVAAFLLGLSAGSFFTRPWLDRLKNPLLVFAYIEVFIAGFSLVA
jgi:predicted membrane-bound spermidine synthase